MPTTTPDNDTSKSTKLPLQATINGRKYRAFDRLHNDDYPSHFDAALKGVSGPVAHICESGILFWVYETRLSNATDSHFDHLKYLPADVGFDTSWDTDAHEIRSNTSGAIAKHLQAIGSIVDIWDADVVAVEISDGLDLLFARMHQLQADKDHQFKVSVELSDALDVAKQEARTAVLAERLWALRCCQIMLESVELTGDEIGAEIDLATVACAENIHKAILRRTEESNLSICKVLAEGMVTIVDHPEAQDPDNRHSVRVGTMLGPVFYSNPDAANRARQVQINALARALAAVMPAPAPQEQS